MLIRPFDWRDLSLLHRLRNRGLCLDAQLAYTRGPNTLQHALLDSLNPVLTAHTLVGRSQSADGPDCLGQYIYRHQDALARVTFVSPEQALGEASGIQLLDGLTRSAGSQGARHLVAEVDEHLPAFQALREAGFAVYARQRIWRLDPLPGDIPEGTPRELEPASTAWRHEQASDELALTLLYANLVPALVQQVEAPPRRNGRGWVHAHQGELLGYLNVDRGPLGTWVQPYLHPAAEAVEQLLRAFLASLEARPGRPLFFVVRSYQGWLNDVLERLGLQPASDQAVMVRRMVVPLRQQAAVERAPAGVTVKTTSPMAHFEAETPSDPPASTRSRSGDLPSGRAAQG
jgi:hypothetical protein